MPRGLCREDDGRGGRRQGFIRFPLLFATKKHVVALLSQKLLETNGFSNLHRKPLQNKYVSVFSTNSSRGGRGTAPPTNRRRENRSLLGGGFCFLLRPLVWCCFLPLPPPLLPLWDGAACLPPCLGVMLLLGGLACPFFWCGAAFPSLSMAASNCLLFGAAILHLLLGGAVFSLLRLGGTVFCSSSLSDDATFHSRCVGWCFLTRALWGGAPCLAFLRFW